MSDTTNTPDDSTVNDSDVNDSAVNDSNVNDSAVDDSDDTLGGDTLGGAKPDASTDASKDPSDWVTGDEPMTGPQRSYLDTLAHQAGETLSADLTKAEASEQIDRLQQKTGRGQS